jgi:hypothetical protein
MARLNITLDINDEELDQAIKFLHSEPDHLQLIKEDYFSKDINIDMNLIEDTHQRYYHSNGIVALLITLQNTQNVTSQLS